MKDDRKICVGAIVGAHGIRGQIRLRSFTDNPEAIFDYAPLVDDDGREFKIAFQGVAKDAYMVSVKGVDDRNGAEALKGTKLFIEREQLPAPKKGEYYQSDLIGLAAKDKAGKIFGTILGVHDYGAGPFLEIGTTKKDSFMLPFNDTYLPKIDIASGSVLIAPPDGWLDKEEPGDGA